MTEPTGSGLSAAYIALIVLTIGPAMNGNQWVSVLVLMGWIASLGIGILLSVIENKDCNPA